MDKNKMRNQKEITTIVANITIIKQSRILSI